VAIDWNQAGVQGPQGIQGPKGDKGDDGTDGTDGTDGAPGAACLPTNPACVGPKGDKGDPGTNGTNGTNGAPGATGATGPQGPQGPAGGVSGYQIVTSTFSVNFLQTNDGTASCPAGKVVVGGGVQTGQFDFRQYDDNVQDSFPSDGGTSWTARVYNGLSPHNVLVYAICING
jgi:hypothetical protein